MMSFRRTGPTRHVRAISATPFSRSANTHDHPAKARVACLNNSCAMRPLSRPHERRTAVRTVVASEGWIEVAGQKIYCSIANISSMGGLIVFGKPTVVPNSFRLFAPEYWFEADCEIRHRGPDRVGVLFTSNRQEALSRFG